MKKLENNKLKGLISAVLLMIVGILFCCSLAMGINGLSMVIGFILLALGIMFVIQSILNNNGVFTSNGIMGVIIITLGIQFMVNKLAYIILTFIPWFLIMFGCALISDTLLGKFIRKNENLTQFVLKLVMGGISILLGILLLTIDGFIVYASLILGIVMIVYAIYLGVNITMKKSASN